MAGVESVCWQQPLSVSGGCSTSYLNAVRYREGILLPHMVPPMWYPHPDMTLQHHNATSHTARSVRDFLQDRNVSVLHGQRRARISIPLSTSGTCWIGGRGLGSGNLQVPWWKSGVTSHSKNWQIWGRLWVGDALQYLMQLVATPDTDCYFILTPLCSGTYHSISISHMSVELIQFMSQLLSLVMFIQIFTHVKFAENKSSWQWEDLFSEFMNMYLL